jgi:hypothetical protein
VRRTTASGSLASFQTDPTGFLHRAERHFSGGLGKPFVQTPQPLSRTWTAFTDLVEERGAPLLHALGSLKVHSGRPSLPIPPAGPIGSIGSDNVHCDNSDSNDDGVDRRSLPAYLPLPIAAAKDSGLKRRKVLQAKVIFSYRPPLADIQALGYPKHSRPAPRTRKKVFLTCVFSICCSVRRQTHAGARGGTTDPDAHCQRRNKMTAIPPVIWSRSGCRWRITNRPEFPDFWRF